MKRRKITVADVNGPTSKAILRQIVGRVHVGTSDKEVLRYVKASLKRGALNEFTRPARKALYRLALKQHAKNRAEYLAIMRF